MNSRAFLLCALFATTGCVSGMGLGRARTLPVGTTQVSWGAELSASSARLGVPVSLPWAMVSMGVRRSVSSSVELGIRAAGAGFPGLGSLATSADVKLQLARRERAGADFSLVTGVGYQALWLGGLPFHSGNILLGGLWGWSFGPHQWMVGVRGYYQVLGAESVVPQHAAVFGVATGFALRVHPRVELQPEVLLAWSPVGFNGEASMQTDRGASLLQFGLSVVYEPR